MTIQDEDWESRFEFDGTKLGAMPIPANVRTLAPLASEMLALSAERSDASPTRFVDGSRPRGRPITSETIGAAREQERALLRRMVSLQERVDFAVYSLFGLLDFEAPELSLPNEIEPGDRWFERQLVRERPTTAWFERQAYTRPSPTAPSPFVTLPPEVRLVEQPTFKRRWGITDWPPAVALAQKELLLASAEEEMQLHSNVERGSAVSRAVVRGKSGTESTESDGAEAALAISIRDESVPFLAAYRFTDFGLEKHAEWQKTWDLQRREDAGEKIDNIPVPPKYAQKDYRDANYWRLRGKLDVPKERFISYPGCESDEDGEPIYGWAGWNHLERAQALAALYNDRKDREGWAKERLLPMLAGILELLPWVKQWHNEPDAEFDGLRLGDYFEGFLQGQMREHGVTTKDLERIRPDAKARRAARRTPN